MRRARAAALAVLLQAAVPAGADPAPSIVLDGKVEHTLTLTADALKALPQASVDASFATDHGDLAGHLTGVLLWDLVKQAGLVRDPAAKSAHQLQRVLLVSGRDGYTVAIAIGEIDPLFEGKSVLLTDDGAPRLIVPGDRRGARNVHDVARIEVE